MISFSTFKGFVYTLKEDVPVYQFQQEVGQVKKGTRVMFQGKENGRYLYC